MALPYIFVAQIVFPVADEAAGSGDEHYLADRPIFLGVLMLPLAFSLTFNLIANGDEVWSDLADTILRWVGPLVALAALIPLRRRLWHLSGLTLLIIDRLVVIVT
jgi:hypothetical protein